MGLRSMITTAFIAVSSPAFAQPANAVQAALDSGFALYAAGKFPEAMLAFEAAALRDNSAAQEILGMMLLKGETLYPFVPADEERALHWLRRAAANGSEIARYQVDYHDRRVASAQR
jgi:TPR repeat protein